MNRIQTFLIASIEAAILVAIGLGVILAPLTIVWFFENDPTVEWLVSFRTAADFWLVSHGTRLVVEGGEILGIAVPQFVISIIPLGVTVWLSSLFYKAGKRFLGAQRLWPGWLGGGLVYGGASLIISTFAYSEDIYPVAWQAVIFPTGLFLFFQVIGSLFGNPDVIYEGDIPYQSPERDLVRKYFSNLRKRFHWSVRSVISPALRAGTAITMMLLAASALAVAIQIGMSWIEITRLYESVQVSILGAIILTLGQIALLPNLVIYTASWFTGVGFSVGTGSLISPLGSQVGPLPAFPVLGALPVGRLEYGMVAIVVVLLSAFIATLSIRSSADEIRFEFATAWSAAASLGVAISLVTALEMMFLATIASGGVGPGRLQVIGVNPWVLGLVVFIEVCLVSVTAALFSARPDRSGFPKPRRVN